jgi:regulatory protein
VADRPSAYLDALHLLARRELSVEALRARLEDSEHPPGEIAAAIERLQETGALDDGRVARTYARRAAVVKGRGRLRVMRELHSMGIDKDVASEALGEVFGDLDERALIARALQKKLHGRSLVTDRAESARLYQYLLRQGFSPAGVSAALKDLRRGRGSE